MFKYTHPLHSILLTTKCSAKCAKMKDHSLLHVSLHSQPTALILQPKYSKKKKKQFLIDTSYNFHLRSLISITTLQVIYQCLSCMTDRYSAMIFLCNGVLFMILTLNSNSKCINKTFATTYPITTNNITRKKDTSYMKTTFLFY